MAHIILIDDDNEMRLLLKEWCESAGHKVSLAADGESGLELCRSLPAELAIVDLVLPGGTNGLRVIEQLGRLSKFKIIAISGARQLCGKHYLPLARALGAQRASAKPFEREELLSAVQEVLQQLQPG